MSQFLLFYFFSFVLLILNFKIMKRIRQISNNPVVIVLVLFNFIFVSCNRDEIIKEQVEQKSVESVFGRIGNGNNPNASLSGEEVFKSIIFADGVLTDQITPLANISIVSTLNANELTEYRNTENDAINYIKTIDPNFFNNFKTAIYSKNATIINNAIEQASSVLTPFIQNRLSENNIDFESTVALAENYKNDVGNIKDFVAGRKVCIYGPVAVAIAIVAVAAVVVVGFGYWWAKAQNRIADDNTIYKDEIIMSIIQAT